MSDYQRFLISEIGMMMTSTVGWYEMERERYDFIFNYCLQMIFCISLSIICFDMAFLGGAFWKM